MRSDHEREELQHCDVATGNKNDGEKTEKQQETQMAPKPKHAAAAADEKKSGNGIIFGIRKKRLTSAQEGKNSNHPERSW
jgi:hypothetical protein